MASFCGHVHWDILHRATSLPPVVTRPTNTYWRFQRVVCHGVSVRPKWKAVAWTFDTSSVLGGHVVRRLLTASGSFHCGEGGQVVTALWLALQQQRWYGHYLREQKANTRGYHLTTDPRSWAPFAMLNTLPSPRTNNIWYMASSTFRRGHSVTSAHVDIRTTFPTN